jgi:hypothetical protein
MSGTHFPPPFTGEVLTPDLIRGKRWRDRVNTAPSFMQRCALQFTSPRKRGRKSMEGEGFDKVRKRIKPMFARAGAFLTYLR